VYHSSNQSINQSIHSISAQGGVPLEAIVERLDKLERGQQRTPKDGASSSSSSASPGSGGSSSGSSGSRGGRGSGSGSSGSTTTTTSKPSGALSVESLEDDSKSLLELVSQTLFDYVTTRLTPRTDRECRWSYAQGKCVPKCKCKYQFQWGDYTLSRSCRVNHNATEVAGCNPLALDESDDNMLVKCVEQCGLCATFGPASSNYK